MSLLPPTGFLQTKFEMKDRPTSGRFAALGVTNHFVGSARHFCVFMLF
jgi:hypothetical protein